MSSEFTIDIQLTELGFTGWDLPRCQPELVKESFPPPPLESPALEIAPHAFKNSEGTHTHTCTHTLAEICTNATCLGDSLQSSKHTNKQQSLIKNDISSTKTDLSINPSLVNTDDSEVHQVPPQPTKEVTTIKNDFGIETKMTVCQSNTAPTHKSKPSDSKKQTQIVSNRGSGEEAGTLPINNTDKSKEEQSKIIDLEQKGIDKSQTDSSETDDSEVSEEEELEDDEEDGANEEEDEEDIVSEMDKSAEHRCHVCSKTFPTLLLLREHRHLHTGVRPYSCAECGKQFCHLANYRAHLRTHAQASAIRCLVCEATFETEEHLQTHLENNHFEKEFYQCDFCKRIFTSMADCKQHVEKHRREAARHHCPKCGRHFRLRRTLRRHLQCHVHRLTLFCSDCGQSFSKKNTLLRHSFSHLGLLPYTCVVCKQHFRLATLYRKHQCQPERIQCVACLSVFQSQDDFSKHKKDTGCWGHQGAQQANHDEIRCMECGEAFNTPEELKKHAGTHQRVLKCSECGMGFRSSIILMSHMKGHVGQQPCLCQDCGLGFPHQQAYDFHLKECGLKPPPLAASQKPKKIQPKVPSVQVKKRLPIAPKSRSYLPTPKDAKSAESPQMIQTDPSNPAGNFYKSSEGMWRLTLDKDPLPGLPLVMFLPIPTMYTSTADSSKSPQAPVTCPAVLETAPPSAADSVQSTVVQYPKPSTVQGAGLLTGTQTNTLHANAMVSMTKPDNILRHNVTAGSVSGQLAFHVPLASTSPCLQGAPSKTAVAESIARTSGKIFISLKNEDGDKKRWTVLESDVAPESIHCKETLMEDLEVDGVFSKTAVEIDPVLKAERERKMVASSDTCQSILIDNKQTMELNSANTDSFHHAAKKEAEIDWSLIQIKKETDDDSNGYGQQGSNFKPSNLAEGSELCLEMNKKDQIQEPVITESQHSCLVDSKAALDIVQIKKELYFWDTASIDAHKRVVSPSMTPLKPEIGIKAITLKTEVGPPGSCVTVEEVETAANEATGFSSVEVEIGEEKNNENEASVGELHECMTCGKMILEDDMVQHYMLHAKESDCSTAEPSHPNSLHSSWVSASPSSPPASPPVKRPKIGTSV